MRFADLPLAEPLLRAVASEGYTTATPVQAQAIPHVLAGSDVLGCAQTGTGKTAAFALPILQRLAESSGGRSPASQDSPAPRNLKPQASSPKPSGAGGKLPRCLVLCPTRELAVQIAESFGTYGRNLDLRHVTIFGGVGQGPQVNALRRGVDIIIATPGRLMDLMNQRHVDLRAIEVLVLDEADRMLDMGFINDIRRITAQLPTKRQTLLFSATMPGEIRSLANSLLHKPAVIQVAHESCAADRIEQSIYHVEKRNKTALLGHLLNTLSIERAIVFTRTKHGADRVVRQLRHYEIFAEAIHGDKTQGARQRALEGFRSGKVHVLIATDIAARGIDVDGISHVFNYDLSHEPESYVHRIGRTARAGASGVAIAFCDPEERSQLRAIERLIRTEIPVATDHPDYKSEALRAPVPHPLDAPEKAMAPTIGNGFNPGGGNGGGGHANNGGGRSRRPQSGRNGHNQGGNSGGRSRRPQGRNPGRAGTGVR